MIIFGLKYNIDTERLSIGRGIENAWGRTVEKNYSSRGGRDIQIILEGLT
jgi:hypothetical protein